MGYYGSRTRWRHPGSEEPRVPYYQRIVTYMVLTVRESPESPMALDRSFDDEADQPQRHIRHSASGADAPVPRAGPAEHRSHAEYYEALRAADGKPADSDDGRRARADARPDDSGWASIDAEERPALDALVVTPERAKHILDGDSHGGGGHRHGTGKPGKTEFPASWDDKKITDSSVDVARRPDKPPTHQDWNRHWLCARHARRCGGRSGHAATGESGAAGLRSRRSRRSEEPKGEQMDEDEIARRASRTTRADSPTASRRKPWRASS